MASENKNRKSSIIDKAFVPEERLCQESKPGADVGWLLEFGVPDEVIVRGCDVLLRYGDLIVDLDACSDGLRYDEFVAIMEVRKG